MKSQLSLLAAIAAIAFAHGAAAQSPTERLQQGPIVSGTGQRQAPPKNLPPGLPGAQVGQDRIAPLDHISTDLAPNDSLFDGINRGDIASVRDALNRGADFNARNVLGLTPLDESIDLGRNDITFLLLSLRGSGPTPDLNPAPPPAGKKPVREATAKPAPVIVPKPAPAPVAPRPVAQAQIQAPRPTDGGAPNPQSGFLGFGG